MAANPGKIHFSEKDFAKYSGKIKGLGASSGTPARHTFPKKRRGGKRFKKAGLFSGKGFLGLGRSRTRIARNKKNEGEMVEKKEPTAKQKRAWNKSRNNPTPKQLAARKRFAAMSRRNAKEKKAKARGVTTNRKKKAPTKSVHQQMRGEKKARFIARMKKGKAQKRRGNKSRVVTRPAATRGARSQKNRLRGKRNSTSSDVRSPTRTATSTRALTTGNVTVTGGAGRGATTRVTLSRPSQANKRKKVNHGGRCNPPVNEVFRTFIGRDSKAITDADFPNGTPTNLAQLGLLVRLVSETETFRFEESERVFLASDARGNLYVGGRQQPVEPNTNFGHLLNISYVTKKAHIEPGQTIQYDHKFGEEGGRCPRLRSDAEGRFVITGGTYTITSAGIAD